jgi:hypothetical protein
MGAKGARWGDWDTAKGKERDKDDVCQIMAWAPERPLVINDREHFALMMPKTMINSDARLQAMIEEGFVLAVSYVNNYPMLAGHLQIRERHPLSGFMPGWSLDAAGEWMPPTQQTVAEVTVNMATGERVTLR